MNKDLGLFYYTGTNGKPVGTCNFIYARIKNRHELNKDHVIMCVQFKFKPKFKK